LARKEGWREGSGRAVELTWGADFLIIALAEATRHARLALIVGMVHELATRALVVRGSCGPTGRLRESGARAQPTQSNPERSPG
jgi:hypothetical protein